LTASSGLDAAGPQFNDSESNEIRLHHTDADFVDAIHTDAGGSGMTKPAGHADFYPNGGRNVSQLEHQR